MTYYAAVGGYKHSTGSVKCMRRCRHQLGVDTEVTVGVDMASRVNVVCSCYKVDVVVDWGSMLVALPVCLDSLVEVVVVGISGGRIGFCGSDMWC